MCGRTCGALLYPLPVGERVVREANRVRGHENAPHPQPLSPAGRGEKTASLVREGIAELAARQRPRRSRLPHDAGPGGPRPRHRPGNDRSPTPQAIDGLTLSGILPLADGESTGSIWSKWQQRFTNYFGMEEKWAAALKSILTRNRFDAVIVVARHLLPLLAVVQNAERIWYPADDPAWHHLSRLKPSRRTWGEARQAAVNALYERAFRKCVDRVWVVSPVDRLAMRWIGGYRTVDMIPNGVDADHYQPATIETIPESCVFWGRLDFGPNVDALKWFLQRIWPAIPLRGQRQASICSASTQPRRCVHWHWRPAFRCIPICPTCAWKCSVGRWSCSHSRAAAGSRTSCWRRPLWECRSSARRGRAQRNARQSADASGETAGGLRRGAR